MGNDDQVFYRPVLRSINDLIEKGMLEKYDASGRSTNYEVAL